MYFYNLPHFVCSEYQQFVTYSMILSVNDAIKEFQLTDICLSLGAVSYFTRLIAIYYEPVYIFLNT